MNVQTFLLILTYEVKFQALEAYSLTHKQTLFLENNAYAHGYDGYDSLKLGGEKPE